MATREEVTRTSRLRDARRAQENLNATEAKAAKAAERRDLAVFVAQANGATYAELADATGLSTARLTQILRRARERRPLPDTA